jgi:leader peptidase (prepilin peptidase) / N-methyltransferase
MTIAWLIIFFIGGAAVGSFLNVVADRLPAGQSVIRPPSHCPICGLRISARDLVPIFSYLWLRGRCRCCDARIPLRSPLVEAGTGIIFALVLWNFSPGWQMVASLFFCSVFIVLLVIDLEQGILPNRIIYPSVIIALIASIFVDPGIVMAAIGGILGFLLLFILALVYRGGMGGGDVKYMLLIGLVTGFPNIIIVILLASISGGILAGFLLLVKRKTKKDAIPFGPFLSLAAIVTLLWGSDILKWYMGLLLPR